MNLADTRTRIGFGAAGVFGLLLGLGACTSETPLRSEASARPAPGSERPGGRNEDPTRFERDVTGRSVKTPRVRAWRGPGSDVAGTTPWLLREDPWMAYARGRELARREFDARDGVYGEPGRLAGPALDDGSTRMASRDHVNGCALCHNVPFGDAGAGTTIAKNSAAGRNTPHGFGAGLLEMLAWQGRQQLLELADRNDDGWISSEEAAAREAILPTADGSISAGRFDDVDGNGRPDLDEAFHIIYGDAAGRRVPWARSLDEPGVVGYSFEWQVFGHGQRVRSKTGGLSSTLRAVNANAFDLHSGLTVDDPTLDEEPRQDGLALISPAGAQQFASGVTRDRGTVRDEFGRSLDDPDRDGVGAEITEGDQDLLEWYLLNHPRPSEQPHPAGRSVFVAIGCAICHVPDWNLDAARTGRRSSEARLGDRRFFDLEVTYVDGLPRARVVPITRGAAVRMAGVYSDFLHHDLGPTFHEVQFDGSTVTTFRTAPLWGVGSSAPYGHDGASLDLDDVIRRHGGEAGRARDAYVALEVPDRADLLQFLRGLRLYALDGLPTDMDGDGRIAEVHRVADMDVGLEVFQPEWRFRVPGRPEGWTTDPNGRRIRSAALTNLRAAYGLDLPGLKDGDGDRWPDLQVPIGMDR